MSLSDKQWIFLQNIAKLIEYAKDNGYKLTGGELYRTEDQQWLYYNGYEINNGKLEKGIRKSETMNSKHLSRLAIDLNIFKDGVLTYDYNDIEPLGLYWRSLHEDNDWGGFWKWKDVPHFQMKG